MYLVDDEWTFAIATLLAAGVLCKSSNLAYLRGTAGKNGIGLWQRQRHRGHRVNQHHQQQPGQCMVDFSQ